MNHELGDELEIDYSYRIVRPPTEEEIAELKAYLPTISFGIGLPADDDKVVALRDIIDRASIAVIPHYVSEYTGYVGKVLIAVYAGILNEPEVFTWNDHNELSVERRVKLGDICS